LQASASSQFSELAGEFSVSITPITVNHWQKWSNDQETPLLNLKKAV